MRSNFKLTVNHILERNCFQGARVIAGKEGLNQVVRWVHVLEVTEIDQLLNGNELILSTGVGWTKDQEASLSFLKQLIKGNASGLCLELGTYAEALPDRMIELAESNNFPLIVFYKTVRFIDITQEINSLFIESHNRMMADLESFSHRLNQLLLAPDALKRILNYLHEYLNVQVVYDPVEGETTFIPDATPAQHKIYMEQRLANETLSTLATQPIEALGYKFGVLSMVADSESFSDFEGLVLDRTATALAQDLLRVLYVEEKRKYKENQWIHKWLDGAYTENEINKHLSNLAPELESNGCMVCLCQISQLAQDPNVTYYSLVFRSIFQQHGFFMLMYQETSQMVLVLINKRESFDWKQRMSKALDQMKNTDFIKDQSKLKKSNSLFGIGKLFDDFIDIPKSYNMAQRALAIQSQITHLKEPFYEYLHVYRLISTLNEHMDLEGYVHEYLSAIINYDNEHNGELMNTLKVLLSVNGSKQEAAKQLFIVRQTLYHRIAKLKELLGDDFMESKKRSAIEMALYGYEYLSG